MMEVGALRVLAGGWEVDREVFCKGLDQVFVEQPQQRKVPIVWGTNCESVGLFVYAR
jgi:hypothetical protein